jgi:hypothetical protein
MARRPSKKAIKAVATRRFICDIVFYLSIGSRKQAKDIDIYHYICDIRNESYSFQQFKSLLTEPLIQVYFLVTKQESNEYLVSLRYSDISFEDFLKMLCMVDGVSKDELYNSFSEYEHYPLPKPERKLILEKMNVDDTQLKRISDAILKLYLVSHEMTHQQNFLFY